MNVTSFAVRIGIVVLVLAGPTAWAQDYPSKPIRIIVPFTPGGGVDMVGRTLAQKLTEAWGQPVVVDNRPGGAGNIGADIVAKAPADGYTLLIGTNPLIVNPSLLGKMPFDPLKDLAPITLAASAPNVLVANLSLPANSINELIALAKAKPGTLNYASGGNGDTGHMVGELIKSATHIDITHIPYKGNPEALNDVLAGRVQLMFSAPAAVIQQVRAGKLTVLAVTGAARYPGLSEVPTFAESGYPGIVATSWYGVLAPAGTSKAVVYRLHSEIVRILMLPEVKTRFASSGYETVTNTPDEFRAMMRNNFIKWQKVIKDAGIHTD